MLQHECYSTRRVHAPESRSPARQQCTIAAVEHGVAVGALLCGCTQQEVAGQGLRLVPGGAWGLGWVLGLGLRWGQGWRGLRVGVGSICGCGNGIYKIPDTQTHSKV